MASGRHGFGKVEISFPRTVPRFPRVIGEVIIRFFELTIFVHSVVDVGFPGHSHQVGTHIAPKALDSPSSPLVIYLPVSLAHEGQVAAFDTAVRRIASVGCNDFGGSTNLFIS